MKNELDKLQPDFCLKMMELLREEILEAQKIRTQVIGLKITSVGAALGYIFAKLNDANSGFPITILFIPAIAAIFFDLLVSSYSFSIKRAGNYIRKYLEPVLKTAYKFDENFLMWEQYMTRKNVKQNLSFIGNLGLTTLACLSAIYGSFDKINDDTKEWVWVLSILTLALLVFDLVKYVQPINYADTSKLDA